MWVAFQDELVSLGSTLGPMSMRNEGDGLAEKEEHFVFFIGYCALRDD